MEFLFYLIISIVFVVLMLLSRNPRQVRALGGALFCTVVLTLDAAVRRWQKKPPRR